MQATLTSTPDPTPAASSPPTLDAILGKCPDCGMSTYFDRATEKQIIETDQELERISPALNAVVRRFGRSMVCRRCSDIKEHMDARDRHAHRLDVLRRRTYREGLMPESAKLATFAGSKKEIENQNPEHWASFRECPLSQSLWIYGNPGTGKTFAARCILNNYLDQYRTVAEISAHKLNELGRSFRAERDLAPYAEANLLLIEDIDKPQWHAEGASALWRLADLRKTSDLRCLITANLTPHGLYAQIRNATPANKTLVSSLFDRFRPIKGVEMTGDNQRRKEAE